MQFISRISLPSTNAYHLCIITVVILAALTAVLMDVQKKCP